jgi:hypothetical protein
MTLHRYTGSCHCGNIALEIGLAQPPDAYRPRACDCDYCRRHAAAYLSDPRGRLVIRVKRGADLGRYRQGDGLADLLFCRTCGVLVGAICAEEGRLYGAVNARALLDLAGLGAETPVSPKTLTARAKRERWKAIWFPDVTLSVG